MVALDGSLYEDTEQLIQEVFNVGSVLKRRPVSLGLRQCLSKVERSPVSILGRQALGREEPTHTILVKARCLSN